MNVAREAIATVAGPRQKTYGKPKKNMERAAKLISAVLDHEVTPHQVPLILIALKLSREAHSPHRDNLVDICGYALIAEQV